MIGSTVVRTPSGLVFALVLFACGACVSALLTALARQYALRRQLLDQPGQRRSHAVATPRGGGIGPVLVLLGGGVLFVATGLQSQLPLIVCLLGLAAVAGIGWVDDHRPLPARLRLAVHLGVALAVCTTLIGVPWIGVPGTPAQFAFIVASTVVMAGLVNAWNFMDGIDGIAASQAGLVALVLLVGSSIAGAWLPGAWWNLGLLLLAAVTGFLPFNYPRARIFLGDVGSGALGFMVAVLLLRAVMTAGLPWPLAALLVSAFVVDAGMTLLLRILRARAWWRPHREHLFQWLVRSGCTHAQVTGWYAVWTLAAGALAVVAARCGPAVGVAVSSGAILSGCLLWVWLRNRLWIAARRRPRRHQSGPHRC
ncbi:MAG TPA: glycosyltransferase family 4 protein [Xanthomonadaceae bacterium]|jgi:UDP-N-acetylmuramyl pentapeptide phosphotransferase/UDP-N-acetylglucosamine-1-phosphate transferase|nr:glycosyltransferase family 4 protein [Xanthomonadaceae bacterium]